MYRTELRRASALTLALAAGITLGVGAASAETYKSASYRLRAPTASAAGGIDQASSEPLATVGELHGIGGQPGTIGLSVGPSTGIRLEGGFHPAIRFVPEPGGGMSWAAGTLMLGLLARRRRGRR